jgi:hypothetical protein
VRTLEIPPRFWNEIARKTSELGNWEDFPLKRNKLKQSADVRN